MKIKIPIEELQNGYIRVMKHPTLDLYIYNYTHKCQFEQHWNEWTMMCRGLILDGDDNIVSRPLKKFFNLGEGDHTIDNIPKGNYILTKKMDGSFLEIVKWNGHIVVATRGSFESDQAIHAHQVLYDKHRSDIDKFLEGFTYILEVIYPENRIVVDYKGYDDLVLLTVVDNETGQEYWQKNHYSFDVVEEYQGKYDIETIKELNSENEEGWVAYWPKSGYRVKIKYSDYVELHRIVTGLSELSIWRLLSQGSNINSIIDKVPDELFKWAQAIVTSLNKEFKSIESKLLSDYNKAYDSVKYLAGLENREPTRKEYALEFKQYKYTSMMFNILNGVDYKPKIWKLIRPKANQIKEVSELPRWN